MIRITTLEHRFVHSVPRELIPGILYVSIDYATVVHSCCCGCGEQVVTPLSPTDWKIIYDGASISLSPSVGNWQLPCRSHYVIRRGQVIEAEPWSAAQIAAEHRRDKTAKASFYGSHTVRELTKEDRSASNKVRSEVTPELAHSASWWSSIVTWLSGSGSHK